MAVFSILMENIYETVHKATQEKIANKDFFCISNKQII